MKIITQNIFLPRWCLVCAFLLALQSQTWAHAFLDHADPKVGSSITAPPKEVKIWFTQELEPAFSVIEVTDAQGNKVDKKDTHLDAKDKSLLVVSTGQLSSGTYTVAWHVVSVDTHKTQGHFQFTIK